MGFGLASLIFGSLANVLFGIMPWQTVFIAIAALGVLIMVALAIIVKPAPANIEQLLTGAKASAVASTPKASPTQQQGILTTKVFWLYCGWATIVIACGLTLIGSSGQGAQALDYDPGFAALLVGLVSTLNGIGRVINGAIFDKVGLVPVMLLGAVFCIVTMAALALSFLATVPLLYVIAAILVAFPYSGVPVMASAYARQRYGAGDFAKNLGIANLNIASAAVLNIILVAIIGSLPGLADLGSTPVYTVLAVLALVALLFVFFFSKAYKDDLAHIKNELS
jgi:OFA family oxalate/formate antiporter-like MFS transporter